MSRLSQSLKRFFRNLMAGGFGQVVNLCTQVVSIPLFLHYWSKPLYGEWLVLTSIPALLWCFEGGLAGVAASRMTVASAADNWHLANVLFQNVLLAQTILCAFIFAGCLIFVQCVDVSNLLHLSHIMSREASDILVVMICYMIVGFFINLLRAAYRASELEARGVIAFNIWRVVDLLAIIAVLTTHGYALRLAVGLTCSATLCLLLIWFDVRRKCPRVHFGVHEASWHQSKRLLIDGTPLLAGMTANALALQGYPLLVNRSLGPSSVVNLTVVRTVSRIILQSIQLLSGASAAELSRTYGRKDWLGYLRLLKIIVAAAFWGGLFSAIALPLFGAAVIKEWTGGKIIMDSLTLFLFGITIALQGAWGVCSTVLVASNMHHIFNYLYLAFTIVALAATPYVILHLGFAGIPTVMIASDLSLLCVAIFLCHKKLKHISLMDLRCIFQPSFYLQKAAIVKKSLIGIP